MVWPARMKEVNKVLRMINSLIKGKHKISLFCCFVIAVASAGAVFSGVGKTDKGILAAALMLVQLVAAASDLNSKMIPFCLMPLSLLLGTAILYLTDGSGDFKNHIIGGLVAFAVLVIMIFISKGQIGGGDLQLFTVTGFYTGGFVVLSIILLSTVFSGLYSLFLLILGKGGRSTEFAFAPFVLYATAIVSLNSLDI